MQSDLNTQTQLEKTHFYCVGISRKIRNNLSKVK